MTRRFAALALLVLACAGCGETGVRTGPPKLAFPSDPVPAVLGGATFTSEPAAAQAFRSVGPSSAVARGAVWTLHQGGIVVGAVQVSQLKGGLSTSEEAVRVGIRSMIGNGQYRWFKLEHRQWVGVQQSPRLTIYLWMPARKDLYEVLQLAPEVKNPEGVLQQLINFQERWR